MAVEGPYTSHSLPNSQSSRAPKPQDGLDVVYGTYSHFAPFKTQSIALPPKTIMPASSSSQSLLASLPSFMSVFGNGSEKIERNGANTGGPLLTNNIHFKGSQHFSSPFPRRDSASTFESTESSPTTTISTLESTLTEPSPQSPPDSPDSSLPHPSLKTLRAQSVPGIGMMDQARKEHFSASFPILPNLERGDSPGKKMRNMKNLSVNTSASNRHGNQLPKLGQSNASHAFSAPPTPAFIVPPKAPRKKPSALGLTITTPEASSNNHATHERPNIVPQTPSDNQIRTLRALQTSTNGPLFSPTLAPEGGMRLPPFSNQAPASRLGKPWPPLNVSPQTSCDNTTSSPITRQTLDHVQEEPDYELPLSQEVKSPAYPQGPVCIYDPYVFLYLEPSDIEAREFDVVLNVAREVKNPFRTQAEQSIQFDTKESKVQLVPETSDASVTVKSDFSTPQEADCDRASNRAVQPQSEGTTTLSPITPKASRPEPEYIHVPWDHNTNVVDDLLRLCELIDSRARQEKRVLVHCQCGVSRSASLVVAYGIYKTPQLTVQEAYDAVKNRSRWIGPNMNLIYQLSEFKTKISKTYPTGTSAWHSWRNTLNSGRSEPVSVLGPDGKSGTASSSIRSTPKTSFGVSAPMSHDSLMPRANSFSPPGSAQLAKSSSTGDITPGPSSAPPDVQFLQGQVDLDIPLASRPSDGESTIDQTSESRPTETNHNLDSTPFMAETDAIKQKEAGPVGAVAQDLQNVARDLDANENSSASVHRIHNANLVENPPSTSLRIKYTDIDEPISPRTVIGPENEKEESQKPILQAPSPVLPAGFSSLRSRRQGPLPLRQLPRRQETPRLVSIQAPQRAFDPDVPPTPSLLSPRVAEFTASPFHRTAAGDLAGSSVFEQALMSPKTQVEDPRSPAARGKAPITRSIFDMI